jgi:hypothetical protein
MAYMQKMYLYYVALRGKFNSVTPTESEKIMFYTAVPKKTSLSKQDSFALPLPVRQAVFIIAAGFCLSPWALP